jgi:hypothetical protein
MDTYTGNGDPKLLEELVIVVVVGACVMVIGTLGDVLPV